MIRWAENKYQIEIDVLPHFELSDFMARGSFRHYDMNVPIIGMNDIYKYVRLTNDVWWISAGERIADSIVRRAMMKKSGCIDEKPELEMLVFLNNPSAQGTWDKDLLAEINIDFGVNFDGMGFDRLDVDLMFDGDSRFVGSALFEDTSEVKQVKADLQEIKDHRKESTEKLKEQNNIDYFFTVVCRDQKEKAELLKLIHIPEHENYISVDSIRGYIERGISKGE